MITQNRLKEVLNYDPETGEFTWKVTNSNIRVKGTIAGCRKQDGYIEIRIDYRLYKAHRLAWLYIEGYFPEHQIDHIDRNPSNNKFENLRHVTQSCNQRNVGNRCDNKSSVKGVHFYKSYKKWNARITVNGIRKSLGYYDDFCDAVCARLAAEQCLNWNVCDRSSSAYNVYMQLYLNP